MKASVLKYAVFLLLVIFACFAYSQKRILRCALVQFADFDKISDNVYVDRNLNKSARLEVSALLASARSRTADKLGMPQANPVIIVASNTEVAKDYGLIDTPGIFFFTPWGNYLVLNHEAKSVDVTAHELVHAEIVGRLGYLKRQNQIPTWFDEGVALQVDYRPQYMIDTASYDQAELHRVTLLDTPKKFWSTDKAQNIKNYQAAKAAVANVLMQHSPLSFDSLLAKIRNGEDFKNVFDTKN